MKPTASKDGALLVGVDEVASAALVAEVFGLSALLPALPPALPPGTGPQAAVKQTAIIEREARTRFIA